MVITLERDGSILYAHVAWSDDPTGENLQLEEYENAMYSGHYIDSDSEESLDPERYEWEENLTIDEEDTEEIGDEEDIPEDEEEDEFDEMEEDVDLEEEEEEESLELESVVEEIENNVMEISAQNESVENNLEGTQQATDLGTGNINELHNTNQGVTGWSVPEGFTVETVKETFTGEPDSELLTITRIQRIAEGIDVIATFEASALAEKLGGMAPGNGYTFSAMIKTSELFSIKDIGIRDIAGDNEQLHFGNLDNTIIISEENEESPDEAIMDEEDGEEGRDIEELPIDAFGGDDEDEEEIVEEGKVIGKDTWINHEIVAENTECNYSAQRLCFDLESMPIGAILDVCDLKIEAGAMATPWRESVEEIDTKAEMAQQTATKANEIASATNQHFWTDDTGVHISNEVDENGNGKPDGAKNSWWNSLGMLFRKGINNIVAILAGNAPNTRGMAIYDGEGNGEENVIAKFTGEGAQIGKTNGLSCMNITPRNMQLTAYNEAYNSRQHIIDIGVLNNPDTGGYNVRIKPEIHLEEYPAGSGTRYAAISLLSPCLPNSVQLFKKEPVSTVITGTPLTLDPSNYMDIITDNEGLPHPDDTIGEDRMLFHMVSFPKSPFENHPINLNADIYIQTNTQVTLNNGTVIPAGTKKPLFNVFYWVDFYEGLNDYVYCIEDDTFELIQKGQTDLVPYMNGTNEVPYNDLPFEYIANNMAILFVGITDKNDPRVKAISSVTYDSTFLRPYFTYGYRNASAPIGLHSITLGDRNSAEDDYTTAIGRENRVTGEHSTAIGSGNTISGANSFSFGFENTVAKNDSCVIGTGNDVSKQDFISMIGTGLIDGNGNSKVAPHATILGVANKPVSNSVFQVGAGKYDKRENAINVSANGRLTLANHDSWVGKVEYATKNVQITSSNTGMDKKVVGVSKTLGAGVWVITAYAGFYTGTGSGTRGIDVSLRLSNDVLRHTRVYNANQNWSELSLVYIANISKPTTYYVCKSATTAEKQAEFTVLHAVRIF